MCLRKILRKIRRTDFSNFLVNIFFMPIYPESISTDKLTEHRTDGNFSREFKQKNGFEV